MKLSRSLLAYFSFLLGLLGFNWPTYADSSYPWTFQCAYYNFPIYAKDPILRNAPCCQTGTDWVPCDNPSTILKTYCQGVQITVEISEKNHKKKYETYLANYIYAPNKNCIPSCPTAPSSSYNETCSNIKTFWDKGHCWLSATCPNYKKEPVATKLRNYDSCKSGIYNCDGHLSCGVCCPKSWARCGEDGYCFFGNCESGCCNPGGS